MAKHSEIFKRFQAVKNSDLWLRLKDEDKEKIETAVKMAHEDSLDQELAAPVITPFDKQAPVDYEDVTPLRTAKNFAKSFARIPSAVVSTGATGLGYGFDLIGADDAAKTLYDTANQVDKQAQEYFPNTFKPIEDIDEFKNAFDSWGNFGELAGKILSIAPEVVGSSFAMAAPGAGAAKIGSLLGKSDKVINALRLAGLGAGSTMTSGGGIQRNEYNRTGELPDATQALPYAVGVGALDFLPGSMEQGISKGLTKWLTGQAGEDLVKRGMIGTGADLIKSGAAEFFQEGAQSGVEGSYQYKDQGFLPSLQSGFSDPKVQAQMLQEGLAAALSNAGGAMMSRSGTNPNAPVIDFNPATGEDALKTIGQVAELSEEESQRQLAEKQRQLEAASPKPPAATPPNSEPADGVVPTPFERDQKLMSGMAAAQSNQHAALRQYFDQIKSLRGENTPAATAQADQMEKEFSTRFAGFDPYYIQDEINRSFAPAAPSPVQQKADKSLISDELQQTIEGRGEVATENVSGLRGKPTKIRTPRGFEVEGEYRIVEADAGRNSFQDGYSVELQDRDTDKTTSREQIGKIRDKVIPADLITDFEGADVGAPIFGINPVDGQLETEIGNHRDQGIREGYQAGRYETYKKQLLEKAETLGFNPAEVAQMKNPKLIRVRTTELSPEDRMAFANSGNAPRGMAKSAAEVALTDAKYIGPALSSINVTEDGEINTAGNRDFFRQFLGAVASPQELNKLISRDGNALTQEGVNRIRNAIFASAYDNSGLVERLADSADERVKRVLSGMTAAAADTAVTKSEIAKGNLFDLQIADDVAKAVDKLAEIRNNGQTVDGYLSQGQFFDDGMTPESRLLLKVADKAKSAKVFADLITGFNGVVKSMGSPAQLRLFEDQPLPSKSSILENLMDLYHPDLADKKVAIKQGPVIAEQQPTTSGWDKVRAAIASAKGRDARKINAPDLTDADLPLFSRKSGGNQTGARQPTLFEWLAAKERSEGSVSSPVAANPVQPQATPAQLGNPIQKSLFEQNPYAGKLKNAVEKIAGIQKNAVAAGEQKAEPTPTGHRVDSVNGIFVVRRPDGSVVKDYMTTNKANAEAKAKALNDDLAKSDKKAPEDGKNEQAKESLGLKDFESYLAKTYGVDVSLISSGDNIELSKIVVPAEKRGQGIGTRAMKELTNYADSNGKTIVLSPSIDFGGSSVSRLNSFYKGFGFVDNSGRNKDFTFRETMYRAPKAAKATDKNSLTVENPRSVPTDNKTLSVKDSLYTVKAVSGGHAIIAPDGSQFSWGTSREAIERRAEKLNLELAERARPESKVADQATIKQNTPVPEPVSNESQNKPESSVKKEPLVKQKSDPKKIEDFGEKLGGAKKDKIKSIMKEFSDGDMRKMPLSEIWPKSEVDEIEDARSAAFAFAARAEIPAKPRNTFGLNRWVEKVKTVRSLTQRFMADPEKVFASLKSYSSTMKSFAFKVELLENLPRESWSRIGNVDVWPDAYAYDDNGKKVPSPSFSVWIDGRYYSRKGTSIKDALELVESKIAVALNSSPKMQFEVRGSKSSGLFKINKKGDSLYRTLKVFPTAKEALDYVANNHNDLVAAWENIKEKENVTESDIRRAENRVRSGKDYRNGKNITPEEFSEAFGFRGIEFGNWVSQGKNLKERQGMLNMAYDALMDLAEVIGVPPKALSLNGSLGVGFGSRGSGRASAHYEPSNIVMNLTKTKGAGSFAHEWFHALDNYFSRLRGGEKKVMRFEGADAYRDSNFITHKPEPLYVHKKHRSRSTLGDLQANHERHPESNFFDPNNWQLDPSHPKGVRPEVERSFAELVAALDDSPMSARSSLLDKNRSGRYWSSTLERAARAFEVFVIDSLAEKGQHNDYLANVISLEDFVRDAGRYPYLLPGEVAPVKKAFKNLFETVKTKETEKGVALYSRRGKMSEMADTKDGVARTDKPTAPEAVYLDDSFNQPTGQQKPGEIAFSRTSQKEALFRGNDKKAATNSEKLARLERILADQEGDESIVGTFKAVSPKTIKDGAPVAAAFDALFGKKVIFFDAGDKLNARFHGVVAPATMPDTIFIEAKTDKAALRVAGHELVHIIKADDPAAYKDMAAVMSDLLDEKAFSEYKARLAELGGDTLTDSSAMEELIGDFVGDQMSNPELWGKLARKEPNLFKRVAVLIQDLFARLKGWLVKNGYESSQFFKDVEAAQDAVVKNIAAYGRKRSEQTGIKKLEETVRAVMNKKADPDSNSLRMVAQAIAEAKKDRSGLGIVADAIKTSYAGKKATEFASAEKAGKTFEGPYDKMPRFEIDDSKTHWKIPATSMIEDPKNPNQMAVVEKLGDIFNHPQLFKNYPALKALPVKILINPDFAPTGAYYPKSGNIVLAVPDLEVGRKVLLHEIQHSIQEVEGFAKGGDWREFAKSRKEQVAALEEKVGELNKKLKKAVGTPDYERLVSEREGIVDEIIKLEGKHEAGADFAGYEDYRRTAGEIESRDVEDRSELTAEEREEFEPFSSAEYDPDEAIVMFSRKLRDVELESRRDSIGRSSGNPNPTPVTDNDPEISAPRNSSERPSISNDISRKKKVKFSLSKLERIAANPDQITDDDPSFLQQVKHFVTHGLVHLTSEISEMDPAFQAALARNPEARTPEEIFRALKIETTNDSRKAEDAVLAAHIRADNSKLIDLAIKYTKPGEFRDWLVKKIRRIVAPFHQAQNIQKVMFMIAERIYWNGEKMIAAPGFRTQDESGNYIYTWENSLVDGETALKAFNQLPQELQDILVERAKKNEQYRQEFVSKWIPRRKVTVGLGAMARLLKQLHAGEERADQNQRTWEKLTKGVNKNLDELEIKLTGVKGQAAIKQLRERFDFLKNRFDQDNSGILKTLETIPESERSIGSLMHEYNSISGNMGHYGYVHHAFEAKQAKNLSPGSGFDASGKFDHPWFEAVSDTHRIREGGLGRVGSLMQADIAQRVKEIRADRRNDWMGAIEDEYGITPESVMDEKGNIQLPDGYDNKSWVVANFGKFAGQKIYVPTNVFALYKQTLERGTVDPELKEISGILDSANQAVGLINEAMLYHPAKFARDLYSAPFHIAEFIRDWTIKNPEDWADVWSLLGKGIKSAVSPSEWQRMNPASFGEYSESLAFQDRKNDSLITKALNAVSGNKQAGSVLASLLKQINLAGAADLPIKRVMKVVGEGLADKRGLKGQERERFVYKVINQYAFDTGDLPGFFSFIRGGRPDSTSKVLGAVSRGTIPFMGYATRLARQLLVTPFTHGIAGMGERTDWKYRAAEISRPLVWMAGAMLIRAGGLGNPPEEEEAAGGLKNKRDLDYSARTATRVLVKRDDDPDGGEYYMAAKGYGHLSLADSVLGAIRGKQTWGDVVQELGNLHPAAKTALSVLGMEDPYSKNVPFSAKAGRMAAMLLLPQSTRLGNDVERLLRLALKDGALPDQERDNFFTAFISQLGIPITEAKYRNGKIVTTEPWVEAVKAAGFNIRFIPYEVVEGEVNKEIPSLKRLAEKIKKVQAEGPKPWEGQKTSDGKPMNETQWLISKGLLGKGRTLTEAREAMEKDLQERSSGLSQTVNALRRVGYKFDEVVDYAKQVQSAVRKISQPKSDDIFKRLLKNAN